ncbi:MAG: transporter substrate-binding domain-containing protein [Acidiferrobacterales bacterium]|nr:transporter substrate-binding domain-containing protein [Acidiferrobacterales bacterium]
MRKYAKILTCGAFLLASVCHSNLWAQSRTVRISTGEWGPYVSENMEHYGIGPQIITAAFAKVGVKTEYQFFPWTRAMKEAEDRRSDLTGIWYYNDERSKKFDYSDNVLSAANIFFYRKNTPFNWTNFETFPASKVGVTRGYSYSAQFDTAAEEGLVKVEKTGSDELNFRKLLRGRIDAFVMAELAGYDMLKAKFATEEREKITAHPLKVSSAPLHLLTAKGNAKGRGFIEMFNKGLKMLEQSGELDAILASYR